MPTSPDQSDFLKGFIDSLGTSKPEYLFYLTKALGYSPTCECAGCGGTNGGTNGMKLACQHGYIKYPFASASLEALKPAVDALWDEDSLVINVFGIAPHFDLEGVLIRIYAYLLGDGLNDRVPAELLPEYVVTYSSGDPLISDNIYTRTGVAYVPGIGIGTIPHNKQYVDFTGDTGFLGRSTTNGFTGSIVVPEEILNIPREHSINKLSICAAVIYPERVMYESTSNNLATRAMPLCGSLVIDIPEKPIVIPTPTISCEGATTTAYFQSNEYTISYTPRHAPVFEIEVNGVNYGAGIYLPESASLIPEVPNSLMRVLSARLDDSFNFTWLNISPNELRVRLLPIPEEMWWSIDCLFIANFNDNPTVTKDETTGIFSFCLSGVEALSWAEINYVGSGSNAVYVDGILIGTVGSVSLAFDGDSRFTALEPGGQLLQIHNNDSVEHFIKIVPISPGNELSTIAGPEKTPFPNPTINCNYFDKSVSFRLAPNSNISCAGATETASFSNGFSGPDYECYLNDVYYGLSANPFNIYEFPELENIVSVSFNGAYGIQNLVAQEQRIKFVCVEGAWEVPTINSDNPTIHIDEATKTITFCLAGVTP